MPVKKTSAPKLNIQHDYITLKLPTGNFTTSRNGAKVSGQLVQMKGSLEALDKYVQTTSKTKSIGEAMNDLLNPKLLNKLVPGWDKPMVTDTFTTGDKAKFTSDLYVKKYPDTYEVKMVKGKYVYLVVPNKRSGKDEVIGFQLIDLKKV